VPAYNGLAPTFGGIPGVGADRREATADAAPPSGREIAGAEDRGFESPTGTGYFGRTEQAVGFLDGARRMSLIEVAQSGHEAMKVLRAEDVAASALLSTDGGGAGELQHTVLRAIHRRPC
jgi:hypothetical protein